MKLALSPPLLHVCGPRDARAPAQLVLVLGLGLHHSPTSPPRLGVVTGQLGGKGVPGLHAIMKRVLTSCTPRRVSGPWGASMNHTLRSASPAGTLCPEPPCSAHPPGSWSWLHLDTGVTWSWHHCQFPLGPLSRTLTCK